jgi:carbohydrate diacid regulator
MNSKEKEMILALAEHDMNISKTADGLYYHRNTITYRLNKIKEKYFLDPTNFYDLIKLVEMAKESVCEDNCDEQE